MQKRKNGENHLKSRENFEINFGLKILEAINTPVSLGVALRIKAGLLLDVVNMSISARDYCDDVSFMSDYQAVSLFSKTSIDVGIDKRKVALERYLQAEELCERTNDRLFSPIAKHSQSDLAIIDGIRRQVTKNLGSLKKKLKDIEKSVGFGSGSTPHCKSENVTFTRKYGLKHWTTTSEALDYLLFCKPPHILCERISIRDVQSLSFVPKNAKTYRTIEIQPEVNSFVQRGIGKVLKTVLRDAGCVIDTVDYNVSLAREGSINDNYVTLDLSMASDTLSIATVQALLPPDWFSLLSMFRTTHVSTYPPHVVKRMMQAEAGHDFFSADDEGEYPVIALEKFSAMGNGYTWELESLIFYSLLQFICGEYSSINAYGDDLVYPVEYDESVRSALRLLGFEVNDGKTFGNGPFRESCGHDFFNGRNVRPFFLRSDTNDDYEGTVYKAANGLTIWLNRRSRNDRVFRLCRRAWYFAFSSVEPYCRNIVPAVSADFSGGWSSDISPSDGGFIGDKPQHIPPGRMTGIDPSWDGIPYLYRPFVNTKRLKKEKGWYLASLAGIETGRTPLGEGTRPRRKTCLGVSFNFPKLSQ